jgi:signal peptidase I
VKRLLKRDTVAFIGLSRDLLDAGYTVKFKASGSSMHPAIHDGDIIFVASVDPEVVKTGDIVLFAQQQRAIAHRVVNIREESGTVAEFVVRGDAKGECECVVKAADVLGRVTRRQTNWRNVLGRLGARRVRQLLLFAFRAAGARNQSFAPRTIRHT